MARPDLFATVDFGASRVLCLLAERAADGGLRLVGAGAQMQRMTLGAATPFDAESRAEAVRIALGQAERMAGGARIERATALVSHSELRGICGHGQAEIDGRSIGIADVATALRAAAGAPAPGNRRLHLAPRGYRLDGVATPDPRGQSGAVLAAEALCIDAPESAYDAAAEALAEAGVELERVIAAPYAAALGVTTPEEREAGVAVIDIGAETTALTLFEHGVVSGIESFAFGGQALTSALADALEMPFAAAERAKVMHGGWAAHAPASVEVLRRNALGRLEPALIARARLGEILGPPLEAALATIKARPGCAGKPLVLTGGCAELAGIEVLATAVWGERARVGRPLLFPELEAAAAGAGLAAGAGAFLWRLKPPPEARLGPPRRTAPRASRRKSPAPLPALGAAWSWLRANF